MNLVFIYRPDIPKEFAISIMYVLKGSDTPRNWQLLRDYMRTNDQELIFKWIDSILKDNQVEEKYLNIGWWKSQLVGN